MASRSRPASLVKRKTSPSIVDIEADINEKTVLTRAKRARLANSYSTLSSSDAGASSPQAATAPLGAHTSTSAPTRNTSAPSDSDSDFEYYPITARKIPVHPPVRVVKSNVTANTNNRTEPTESRSNSSNPTMIQPNPGIERRHGESSNGKTRNLDVIAITSSPENQGRAALPKRREPHVNANRSNNGAGSTSANGANVRTHSSVDVGCGSQKRLILPESDEEEDTSDESPVLFRFKAYGNSADNIDELPVSFRFRDDRNSIGRGARMARNAMHRSSSILDLTDDLSDAGGSSINTVPAVNASNIGNNNRVSSMTTSTNIANAPVIIFHDIYPPWQQDENPISNTGPNGNNIIPPVISLTTPPPPDEDADELAREIARSMNQAMLEEIVAQIRETRNPDIEAVRLFFAAQIQLELLAAIADDAQVARRLAAEFQQQQQQRPPAAALPIQPPQAPPPPLPIAPTSQPTIPAPVVLPTLTASQNITPVVPTQPPPLRGHIHRRPVGRVSHAVSRRGRNRRRYYVPPPPMMPPPTVHIPHHHHHLQVLLSALLPRQ